MLALSRMDEFAQRLPRQLSGGQQQRVALARALAVAPNILLLDEPFAALDKDLRLDMQIEIKKLQKLTGVTTVIVTHDQEEALALADRVAVMSRGRVEQFGSPAEIYDNPATLFVSQFVGTTNLLAGRVARFIGQEADVALDCGPTIRATHRRSSPRHKPRAGLDPTASSAHRRCVRERQHQGRRSGRDADGREDVLRGRHAGWHRHQADPSARCGLAMPDGRIGDRTQAGIDARHHALSQTEAHVALAM